jgi:hypothetical protein
MDLKEKSSRCGIQNDLSLVEHDLSTLEIRMKDVCRAYASNPCERPVRHENHDQDYRSKIPTATFIPRYSRRGLKIELN